MRYEKCNRCHYEWVPRVKTPARCPRCMSPYWNKERVRPPYKSAQPKKTWFGIKVKGK